MPRASRRALACRLGLLGLGLLGVGALGAGPLDPPSEGRSLYHGLASAGQACASCHGLSGEGGSEGGTAIPSIQGMFAESQPYREPATLCRALTSGRGAGGRPLARSMPRYALDPGQCRSLWRYLADRGSSLPPGIDAEKIVVRMQPTPTTPSQKRWRDVLASQFSEINRGGGLYGRRIVVEAGPGPSAFLISLAPAGPLDGATAVRIALREAGGDPAARGIEATVQDEAAALINHLKALGTSRVRWVDERETGPSPDHVGLLAAAEEIALVGDDSCRDAAGLTVVVVSARAPLTRECAASPRLYVGLRTVAIASLESLLPGRRDGTRLTMFTPLPLDTAFAVAPGKIAQIVIETSRAMTARPSELRMLASFDRTWRLVADDDRTLFAGVATQDVDWPSMTASSPPGWTATPN
ncbi:MAG TPA: hypothetical protein VE053_16490 [Allosphingosinicella sp.]|nr:hypothetical protein [Allosphingosinicella sp.]